MIITQVWTQRGIMYMCEIRQKGYYSCVYSFYRWSAIEKALKAYFRAV